MRFTFRPSLPYSEGMELHEIDALSLEGARAHTVPVPESLDRDITAHPEEYGLPEGISARRARAMLLLQGARAAKLAQREAAREETYRRMAADPEWRQARDESRVEAEQDRRF
jgi:hypothetical protein